MDFERITFDQKVMGGRACIRGMKVMFSSVVNPKKILMLLSNILIILDWKIGSLHHSCYP
jgi:hypothetical protein